jgi:hypothetical protein
MSTRLELQFETSQGKNRTLGITNPVLDLEAEEVKAAMETISKQGLFEQDDVMLYSGVKGARYVTRLVDEIFDVKEIAE